MKTSRILPSFALLVLLIACASAAVSVVYGEWNGGSSSLLITNGSDASFNYYFYNACAYSCPSMSMSIKLYASSGNLVHTFLDTSTSGSYYYNNAPVEITPSIYKNPGDYYLVFSSDSTPSAPSTSTIYLNVAPVTPGNGFPVIHSSPETQVNEGTPYFYQVNATDPDGDSLAYSLLQNPLNFSINSSGFVSGMAPNVTANSTYTIGIQVSDGINSTAQIYNLTVINLVPSNQTNITSNLSIQFIPPTPADGSVLQQDYIPFGVNVTNSTPVSQVLVYLYNSSSGYLVSTLSPAILQSEEFSSLPAGNYYIYATVFDNSGDSSSTGIVHVALASAPSHHYVDVYAVASPQGLGYMNKGVVPSAPPVKAPSTIGESLLWLLIFIILVLIAGVLILLMAVRKREPENKA